MATRNSSADLILNLFTKIEPGPVLQPQAVNNCFIIDIVQGVSEKYKFKNFYFFISEHINLFNPWGHELLHYFYSKFPLVPRVILRHGKKGAKSVTHLITEPALILIYTTDHEDAILDVASEGVRGMHWLKTIFILLPRMKTQDYRENLVSILEFSTLVNNVLKWTWKTQFTKMILLTIQNNVYLLKPYPTPRMKNKTDNWVIKDFFKHYSDNMKGYAISTPILNDIPRVFRGSNEKTVYGTSAEYFLSFINFVNATLLDTTSDMNMKYFSVPELLQMVADGVYETVIHSYTDVLGDYSVNNSYPIGINDWCIMVPHISEKNKSLYVHRALENTVWLLLVPMALYITFAIWLFVPRRSRDLGNVVMQTICTFLNIPPLNIVISESRRMRFVFVLISIFGLVLSTMYATRIGSFLIVPPSARQLTTPQDIIDADLRIMVQQYERDRFLKSPQIYPPRFMEQVIVETPQVVQAHRDMLNTSYGYVMASDRWSFINMQQGHLRQPIFKLTEICSGPFYHVFPMHQNSHLRNRHQEFILISQQTGLSDHWRWMSFLEALHMGIIRLVIIHEQLVPLDLSFFTRITTVWYIGLLLAGVVFAFEMKWHEIVLKLIRRVINFFRRILYKMLH